jgi:hypothetical protein
VIVARGLSVGGGGTVVAWGLGRKDSEAPARARRAVRDGLTPAEIDERELLEIVPAIIGVLNAQHRH